MKDSHCHPCTEPQHINPVNAEQTGPKRIDLCTCSECYRPINRMLSACHRDHKCGLVGRALPYLLVSWVRCYHVLDLHPYVTVRNTGRTRSNCTTEAATPEAGDLCVTEMLQSLWPCVFPNESTCVVFEPWDRITHELHRFHYSYPPVILFNAVEKWLKLSSLQRKL